MTDEINEDTVVAPEPAIEDEPVINEQQAMMALEVLRSEQNLVAGTATGFVAAILGAGVWAGVTIFTEYQIGWMAVGVGFLVGFAVRMAGKGLDQSYGIVGAAMALLGCALGNVLTYTYFIAVEEGVAFMDIFSQLSIGITVSLLTATFEAMDVLFYGLAIYCGYKFAFREITQADLDRALGKGF